ncbi:L2 [Equus caballus papillomavirus 4]|uniref:Minor capsid protein L2 n=1 Tax=Equus caballus papillomavirus 4 TaxID=1235428 RepID=K9M932_9PAPI|nr:L2 [Equus caballus papillomavirus 4]AFS89110.1 L2 [Equus caballus papillomavirus 4]
MEAQPPLKRRKRASVENLYRSCKLGGDCPADVVPKVEGDTPADRILKWLSSFLFFGNLGISSTGRGVGGFRPLGGGAHAAEGGSVRVGTPISTVEVGSAVDSVGPLELAPIDGVTPTSPAVVSMGEGVGEAVDVFAEVTPPVGGATIGSEVNSAGVGEPAILDVSAEVVPKLRAAVTSTEFHNPAFQVEFRSVGTGETSGSEQAYWFGHAGGHAVGEAGESIELVDLNYRGPKTSTPSAEVVSEPRLWGRRFQQVRVQQPEFVTAPQTLVEFGFSNPAYDPEGSLLFTYNESAPSAAPSSPFQDIAYLGRPEITARAGRVGVSRYGRRATLHTRAGTILGGEVHFRYDFSSIEPETLELSDLTVQDSTSLAGLSSVDLGSEGMSINESWLGEDEQVSFHGVLAFSEGSEAEIAPYPRSVWVRLAGEGSSFSFWGGENLPGRAVFITSLPSPSATPPTSTDTAGFSMLDPSLLKRCRRKRRSCFADGIVDARQSEVLSAPCSCDKGAQY